MTSKGVFTDMRRVTIFDRTVFVLIYCLAIMRKLKHSQKSNPHHTRGITSICITSGGTHLRDLAPGQHSSEKTSQRWRAAGDTVPI